MKFEDTVMKQGEIHGVIHRHLKKYPHHEGYPLRMVVAKAQAEITWKAREPEIEEARKIGIREVVDDMTIACATGNTEKQRLTSLCDVMRKYEALLKE